MKIKTSIIDPKKLNGVSLISIRYFSSDFNLIETDNLMITIKTYMIRFIKIFLIGIASYFMLHTIVVYGIFDGHYKEFFSSIKECIRIGVILVVWLSHSALSKAYCFSTRRSLYTLSGMLIIGLLVTAYHTDSRQLFLRNSMIGIKYGRYSMWIFWSAWLLWYCMPQIISWSYTTKDNSEKNGKKSPYPLIEFVVNLSRWILRWWLVVQWCKFFFPEFWYALGFGWLDIYKVGVAPPLYYLTKQDGIMRYSWVFAWPNNTAFWLVAISPLLWNWTSPASSIWKKRSNNIALLFFWSINIGRAVIVGWFWQLCIYFLRYRTSIFNRTLSWFIIASMIIAVWCITYLKWESTLAHFQLSIHSFSQFTTHIRWYGLWSSGPGIHRNGSLLPENYYLQLALDYGRLWPVCFTIYWYSMIHWLRKNILNKEKNSLYQIHLLFLQWFIGLLIVWLFLHVFEDSMVNYLFFIPRWVVYGGIIRQYGHQNKLLK